jgi:hypothetical protein
MKSFNLVNQVLFKILLHYQNIEIGGKKLAYLMYNQFVGFVESENKDYNSELNEVFANF